MERYATFSRGQVLAASRRDLEAWFRANPDAKSLIKGTGKKGYVKVSDLKEAQTRYNQQKQGGDEPARRPTVEDPAGFDDFSGWFEAPITPSQWGVSPARGGGVRVQLPTDVAKHGAEHPVMEALDRLGRGQATSERVSDRELNVRGRGITGQAVARVLRAWDAIKQYPNDVDLQVWWHEQARYSPTPFSNTLESALQQGERMMPLADLRKAAEQPDTDGLRFRRELVRRQRVVSQPPTRSLKRLQARAKGSSVKELQESIQKFEQALHATPSSETESVQLYQDMLAILEAEMEQKTESAPPAPVSEPREVATRQDLRTIIEQLPVPKMTRTTVDGRPGYSIGAHFVTTRDENGRWELIHQPTGQVAGSAFGSRKDVARAVAALEKMTDINWGLPDLDLYDSQWEKTHSGRRAVQTLVRLFTQRDQSADEPGPWPVRYDPSTNKILVQ